MKKNHLLSAAAFIIAASASCSRIEEGLGNADPGYTALDVSIMMHETQSKGLVTGTSLPEGTEVGLSLYETDGNIYDNLPYSNVRFSSSGSGSSQTWNPDTDVMLSASEAILYAYYPYASEITDVAAIPVTATSEVQTDYMYASPVSGLNNNSPKAAITMHHALSAIRLSMKRGTYTGTGEVTSISVKGEGIATEGILNAKDGTLTSVSATDIGIAPALEAFTLSSDLQGTDIITIPAGAEKSIEMEITIDGEVFSLTTDPITLEAGKIAVYEATVNNADISLSSVRIADWTYNSAGTPIIRQEWTVTLEGDIDGISFANSVNDDGSIEIIAVPIASDASIDPVTVEGSVTCTQSEDYDRGIRTIVLSEIQSDVTVTFNGYSLWLTATYDIDDVSSATNIINSFTSNYIKRMMVDGKEVSPSTSYLFEQTGEHIIRFSFKEYINSGTVVAKYHIPELGFGHVADVVSITVPEGYTLFRNQVFTNCSKLTSVSMPSTLTSIGYNTFYNSKLIEEISFPDNITTFPDSQCKNCTSLRKVKLPANLVNLGSHTFSYCPYLTELDIPESVTTIGDGALEYSGITRLHIPDKVSVFPKRMCMECRSLEELKLPASLTEIKYQSLYNCRAMNKIIHADGSEETGTLTIPEGVTTVGSLALIGCPVTTMSIPSTLTSIASSGLANANVETFTCHQNNSVYEIRSNAVVEKATNTLIAGCKASLIDETVTTIGNRAFYSSPVKKIDLHAGIVKIDNEAFLSAYPNTIISRALTPPELGTKAFQVAQYYGTLKVPEDALAAYQEKWMIDEIGYLGWSTCSWSITTLTEGE